MYSYYNIVEDKTIIILYSKEIISALLDTTKRLILLHKFEKQNYVSNLL